MRRLKASSFFLFLKSIVFLIFASFFSCLSVFSLCDSCFITNNRILSEFVNIQIFLMLFFLQRKLFLCFSIRIKIGSRYKTHCIKFIQFNCFILKVFLCLYYKGLEIILSLNKMAYIY